jgi:hypothetical protein
MVINLNYLYLLYIIYNYLSGRYETLGILNRKILLYKNKIGYALSFHDLASQMKI